ncbi:DUF7504 family protein [Halalkalicoccus subterraneus]|uniref:DUF7504 family protein n=1 Tax=Halalkalicoccus subterraneus TaxID=2675002 RepID=UPI000EFCC0CE|nr:recombinase RecA [Halalkalicoccus subterraneus]
MSDGRDVYGLPIPDATVVDPGTNLLVVGPAMTGKQRLGLEALAAGSVAGDGAVVVSTRDTGSRLLETYTDLTDADDPLVGIIDCVTTQQGVTPTEDDRIRYTSSHVDMTEIGIAFSELLESFYGDHGRKRNRVLLSSLSTLLMYADLETVFRFLHVFTGRVRNANALGLYCLDSTAHDVQTINTLTQLFDGQLTVSPDEAPTVRLSEAQRLD